VGRGSSTREQEDPEVRGGVGIANQSGFIVSSQGSTTSSSSYPSLIAQPTTITTEPRHRRALLIANPVHRGNSLSTVLLHNQSYPKICPDSLNLLNASDSFGRNIIVIFLFSVFPDQGLDCFDLESSRVFFVKFPKPSLFQISELLHYIEFRKKFIKVQNQFCLKP
jgi:hypothetical protein